MAQTSILILAASSEQLLGVHIQAILQRERTYQVDLRGALWPAGITSTGAYPDVIILVLPTTPAQATHHLAALQAQAGARPLSLVLQTPDLVEPLDGLCRGSMDILLTPLREAELRLRVRRCVPGTPGPGPAPAHIQPSVPMGLPQLIGEDPAFAAVKRKLPGIAREEVPVLITGETGTGKEVCARALHYLSRRAAKPFLPVNCGAIPVDLFERELFGHARGAFTGAAAAQPGLLAEAEGGTLFLDEVETLSLNAQVKLLRFLQDRTYHALGAPRLQQANVWILAATNVTLPHKVEDGTFRADLFYRLAVLTLTLPPLRERPTDIPRLVAHIWARYTDAHPGAGRQLSPAAVEALCHYPWPGNIRELENVLRQSLVMTDALTIEPADLPIPRTLPWPQPNGASLKQAKAQVIEQFEKGYLSELLRVHQGNVTRAARAAQKERRAFGRLLKKYHLV